MKVRQFTLNENMLDKLLITGQLARTVEFDDGEVEHIRIVVDDNEERMCALYQDRDYSPE